MHVKTRKILSKESLKGIKVGSHLNKDRRGQEEGGEEGRGGR